MTPLLHPPTAETRADVVARVLAEKAVAVVRLGDPDRLVEVAQALSVGGIVCVEVTLTIPNALDGIRLLRQEMGRSVLIGAGSVLDAATAEAAVEAGARYVVSPIYRPEILRAAHGAGAACMPGCFTPTEIWTAADAGADVVKVFPADVLGPAFFTGVLAPMPHLRLMPTGGVSLDNAGGWLRAGAVAVGVGSALVDPAAVAAGDWAALTRNARRLVASIHSSRA